MADGNTKGPDIVEGSYRNVETTRKPDGEVKLNPQPDQVRQTEVKKGLWQKFFGKKSPQEKTTAAINLADDTLNRLSAQTDIKQTTARKTTANRINEMKQVLGPAPKDSADLDAELARMKKARGLK